MSETFNILFTSAGRRVALIRLFRQALDALGLAGKLVAADVRGTAPARFVSDVFEEVAPVGSPGYVDRLREICREHRIRLVVPLIDTELQLLARHRENFLADGITPLVSSSEVTQLSYDKRLTESFFRKAGMATPGILDPRTVLTDPKASYPFFLKPACGSSSVGATRIDNRRQLEFFLNCTPDPVLQEFVAGQEYTLDILADFAGRVRCVVPRLRIETRAGEVSKGMTVKNQALIAAGKGGRRGSSRRSGLHHRAVFLDAARGDPVHRDQSSLRRRISPVRPSWSGLSPLDHRDDAGSEPTDCPRRLDRWAADASVR